MWHDGFLGLLAVIAMLALAACAVRALFRPPPGILSESVDNFP